MAKRRAAVIESKYFADIAQSAEHILGKDEVTRSNRVISSIKNIPRIYPGDIFCLL